MSALRKLLDQLEAARAAGTSGEWFTAGPGIYADLPGHPTVAMTNAGTDNAALIVSMHKLLPELVARLRAVADLRDRWRDGPGDGVTRPMPHAAAELGAALDGEQP